MNPIRAFLPLACAAFVTLAHAGAIEPYNQGRVDQAAATGQPVLLAIQASWCPTCKAQRPIIDRLMAKPAYQKVTMFTIDFDTQKALLERYHVAMQSTLIAFKGAKEVGRSVGDTTPAGIEALVKKTVD